MLVAPCLGSLTMLPTPTSHTTQTTKRAQSPPHQTPFPPIHSNPNTTRSHTPPNAPIKQQKCTELEEELALVRREKKGLEASLKDEVWAKVCVWASQPFLVCCV